MKQVIMKQIKRCPHCGGNLFLSVETGAPEWTCLQCARTYPAVVTAATVEVGEAAGQKRKPAPVRQHAA